MAFPEKSLNPRSILFACRSAGFSKRSAKCPDRRLKSSLREQRETALSVGVNKLISIIGRDSLPGSEIAATLPCRTLDAEAVSAHQQVPDEADVARRRSFIGFLDGCPTFPLRRRNSLARFRTEFSLRRFLGSDSGFGSSLWLCDLAIPCEYFPHFAQSRNLFINSGNDGLTSH